MWFAVELPEASNITELQFESMFTGGGRGGRGAAGGTAPAPVAGFPRSYSVETSMDGKTWSKPVAVGKGVGPRTTITFAPTLARYIRITQTDSLDDAPVWSIRNLRIYEAKKF
jgi:hypothetical protein